MATKLERLSTKLNDDFRDKLADAVREKFGLEIETSYAIFAGRIITTRVDSEPFTKEQMEFMQVFEQGYMAAWDIVKDARRSDVRKAAAHAAGKEQ